jgi:hypothetical protein
MQYLLVFLAFFLLFAFLKFSSFFCFGCLENTESFFHARNVLNGSDSVNDLITVLFHQSHSSLFILFEVERINVDQKYAYFFFFGSEWREGADSVGAESGGRSGRISNFSAPATEFPKHSKAKCPAGTGRRLESN